MVPLSVLDVAPIGSGQTASETLRASTELALLAERLGYVRHWFAEHHGMPNIASSSPEVLIGHIASATRTIRVGSGGIMLPNHAPLRIAEAFHTLEALHPGRIDLGIGRAPGSDRRVNMALRPFDPEHYPQQLQELFSVSRGDFPDDHVFRGVRAVPSDVSLPPVWLLGSSGGSAALAGSLGTGYGFARHFSPAPPGPALRAYREAFEPSERFPEPHVILAVSVVCAPTDEEAERLASTLYLTGVRIHRQEFRPLPTPEEALAYEYSPTERIILEQQRARHFVGSPETVRSKLASLVAETDADELMVTCMIHGREERHRSYELLAAAMAEAA
ncbi:MAG TPA: LLM class flavin-dependent oxidoreductase [Longimicrobiales bacterium]|nr:LLM class flavin-dependent oxidoreductase [Longimicrobiales bacterium]